ncbi:UxaA family hydrolase [Sphingomonas floccifaciens]|uniref:UxaA family hydrolase n=1 Tax=Sphingomonas floccifaciens TaxID=1844115 RepID=A0ABW4NIV1_9SPHN
MTTAFRIHPRDTVATLLEDGDGVVTVLGMGEVPLRTSIALGHKVALVDMASGDPVVKFGIPIGTASTDIARGDWVHLHNCTSGFDERSGGFDVVTGAAQDIRYD